MLKFLYQQRFILIGAILGAVSGYVYWYFWGCAEGCSIRSVWWRMSAWGALMGGLLFSAIHDFRQRKSASE